MKLSLRDRILGYLRRTQTYVHKGELEKLVIGRGYLAETGNRALRKLEEEGLILSEPYGKSQRYRAAPPKEVQKYIIKEDGVGAKPRILKVPIYD